MAKLDYNELLNVFIIQCEFWENHKPKSFAARKWHQSTKSWHILPDIASCNKIKELFDEGDEFTPAIIAKIDEVVSSSSLEPFPAWYKFKGEPMKCQMEALQKSFTLHEFAFIMDMGTGKTFTAINFAAAKAMMGLINGFLIVCDTGVKSEWVTEFEKWSPIDYDIFVMESGKQKVAEAWINKPSDRLKVFVVGVESLSTGPYAYEMATQFLNKHTAKMTIDESTSIKNPQSKRTKKCWDLGAMAEYRSILNGTPVDEGVENLFAQFRFLNWGIISTSNFTHFKNKYCVMGGFEARKIVGYNNLTDLFKRIEPYLYTVKITDVEDMPERLYETIHVEPTAQQSKAFKELADPMMRTTQGDHELDVETVLERMTRYQQIAGGYFPYDLSPEEISLNRKGAPLHGVTKIEGKNPKMEAMLDLIEKTGKSRKIIIWARFKNEREDIIDEISRLYPNEFVAIQSGMGTDERISVIREFQTNPKIRFFVTSQNLTAKGVTLTAATMAIYYSNSFSYNQREQSERRPWRKGQTHPCLYVDLVMNHKIEKMIVKALKDKKSLAEFVMEQL